MKFRKKPVMIEAWCWNETQMLRRELESRGMVTTGHTGHRDRPDECTNMRIRTLESGSGSHVVDPGDWIIRGVKGEFYPCKPDIFAATYEPVNE